MSSDGDYALGLIGLAAIVISLALAARISRRALLPEWDGPPALLAEAILAIGAFVLISEALGLVGLLDGVLLVAACLLVGGSAVYLERFENRLVKGSGPAGGDGPMAASSGFASSGPSPPAAMPTWQLAFGV